VVAEKPAGVSGNAVPDIPLSVNLSELMPIDYQEDAWDCMEDSHRVPIHINRIRLLLL
jgi:hypothetical protein